MSHTHPTCWLCDKRLYRGRFGIIAAHRATALAGRQQFHNQCAKRFDEEGESAALKMVQIERAEELRCREQAGSP